jgi:hypothetical protein
MMAPGIKEKLQGDLLFDNVIVEHHFTPYLRDYNVIIDVPAARPDGRGSYIEGRYRYRFTHCPVVQVTTAVRDDVWRESWSDLFTDCGAWERAGMPEGYVWGGCFSVAYPGLTYVEDSHLARDWSARFGYPMHEVRIETNGHNLSIVFHDVDVRKIAQGNPDSENLHPLEPGAV